jgi:hypothetical protein
MGDMNAPADPDAHGTWFETGSDSSPALTTCDQR